MSDRRKQEKELLLSDKELTAFHEIPSRQSKTAPQKSERKSIKSGGIIEEEKLEM